jgi:hypothetical protein
MTCRGHGDKAPYILNLKTTFIKDSGQSHATTSIIERKMTFLPSFIKTGHLDQKFSFLGNGRGKKVEETEGRLYITH